MTPTQKMLRSMLIAVVAAAVGAVLGASTVHHDEMARPILSSTEISFAQDMSVHHQQAVTMADMVAPDASPPVKALAEQIRYTQLAEIGQMTGWLQLAGAAPAAQQPMTWMAERHGDHADHPMGMPGMATPTELGRLQHSTGHASETLFLQLMTRHHQGGITMAAYVFQRATSDAVRRAASIMVAEQTEEVQLMGILLDKSARPG